MTGDVIEFAEGFLEKLRTAKQRSDPVLIEIGLG